MSTTNKIPFTFIVLGWRQIFYNLFYIGAFQCLLMFGFDTNTIQWWQLCKRKYLLLVNHLTHIDLEAIIGCKWLFLISIVSSVRTYCVLLQMKKNNVSFILQHHIPFSWAYIVPFVILRHLGVDIAIDYVSVYWLNGKCSNPTWPIF